MKTKVIITAAVILFSFLNLGIAEKFIGVDDSDLSGWAPTFFETSQSLQPDQLVQLEKRKDLKVEFQFLYERNGNWVPISGLKFQDSISDLEGKVTLDCNSSGTWSTELATSYFKIQKRRRVYKLNIEAECGSRNEVRFAEATQSGQAISIFETFERGRRMLDKAVGLAYWNNQLKVEWPSNGDYYSWGTVNITNGHHWDIVAHEMGHAIYDYGNLGQFGGGPHKIDQCYSKNLALSEGWASFFAAWLYIDLADPDAKFQYLVPRRAPIEIEHVPEDVCRDTTNEWRVTSFFWDVVDFNRDLEEVEETFRLTWEALYNSNVGSVEGARSLLESKGVNKGRLERAWNNNF